jgi:hypothetical protein
MERMGKQKHPLVDLWHKRILKADSIRIHPQALQALERVNHTVDFQQTEICKKSFYHMIRQAPKEMRADRECLLFFVGLELYERYGSIMSERRVMGWDTYYVGLLSPYGVRVVPLLDFPDDQISLVTVDRVHVTSYAHGKQFVVDNIDPESVCGYNVSLFPMVDKFNIQI